jgi:predicted helicase
MSKQLTIKPTSKPIQTYYAALESYGAQGVEHEGALETAFQRLLADTARLKNWTLIPKLKMKVGGKTIFPDGTVRDDFYLPRGYWEAKDTHDDLDQEIVKKIGKGYPLTNTIFEDTRQAVLYQTGEEALRIELSNPQGLCDLLSGFYAYTEPDIEGFEQAVQEFKDRVPDLAGGLNEKIKEAHKKNKKFQAAFDDFLALCQQALNPNIRTDAVDEMLVQHLLTERLIRKIFDNAEFTRRNVIAAEVEKVITALVSQSFDRDQFLKSLDRFYRAIEDAAHSIEDFNEKQHFLNTVYERFFQGYSVKLADTHGIVYTPQAIVDFMCASVEAVLKNEFDLSLGSAKVNILDPCTGTGNFIVNLLRRIPRRDLARVYQGQLFANEVMLLPYYVSALNIEHAYFEQTGNYEAFEGLCFVDTLDMAEGQQQTLAFMTEANTARVERQKRTPVTVIIGNPPYNQSQQDENDKNKNRKYHVIDRRISDTYIKDSDATLRMQVYDPYVKFFRWATDRLQERDGIVCMVTNNSFVDQLAFAGVRKHLLQDFTCIYHVDLHGNVRKNPKLSGTTHNVFGIQVGVGITVAVRSSKHKDHRLFYHRVPEDMRREDKLKWLATRQTISGIEWASLIPDRRNTWLISENADEFEAFLPLGTKTTKATSPGSTRAEAIFKIYSNGIETNSDVYVYDFNSTSLSERAEKMVENFNSELDRWKRLGCPKTIDEFLHIDESVLKWVRNTKRTLLRGQYLTFNENLLRTSLYRPFTKKHLYFERAFSEDQYRFRTIFPTPESEDENMVIGCTNHTQIPFIAQITNTIPNRAIGGRAGQCFPFYVYDEDGSNRRENVTNWAVKQFREHYKAKAITKHDIFYYVYGSLHLPSYRERFADNLKKELPRIPFLADFQAVAEAGKRLAELHLGYERLAPWPLEWLHAKGTPLSFSVEKMKLSKDKTSLKVNDSLALAHIPPEAFDYRLGNRSALDWIIDQYQVSEDTRSGITSDPNRPDDEEYIVRLVGQVIRVSVETVRIVSELSATTSLPDA